jgi:hypothetical protein
MNKVLSGIFALCLLISCEYRDTGIKCYHGKVILSSCCSGSTFINLDTTLPLGKKTAINGQDYDNMIQLPGDYLANEDIYMNLRTFDPNKDYALFPPHCYCLIAIGSDVPLFVATAFSYSSCPPGASRLD